MRNHRPRGAAVLTWEADILKVRALEMVLMLFYVQELKEFILGSIEGTDRIRGVLGIDGEPVDRLSRGKENTKEGKKLDRARELLVSEGVITQHESDELFYLIDYRNSIGHAVHKLTADIGEYAHLGDTDPITHEPITLYDYTAAKRAKDLSNKIHRGMIKSFIMPLGFDHLRFEAAEKTYLAEVNRLKKNINRSIEATNKEIHETNRIIGTIPESVKESAIPGHPRNLRRNGSLTRQGRQCAFELFDAGATSLAVAYMMRISLRSANLWHRKWTATACLNSR